MEGRTAINLACGVIIAQSRCSQEEASDVLPQASISRNQKLHTMAAEILRRCFDTAGTTTRGLTTRQVSRTGAWTGCMDGAQI